MCKLSVKATCQNPPHKSVSSNSFLTHLICLSLRHLSAQIVLLINYAIIPIRWLIAGSSFTFLVQISSLTTLAATGQDKLSDAACSCMMLQLHVDTTDLWWAASLPASDGPPDTTTSVVSSYSFTGKSRHWFTVSYLHQTVTLVWISSKSDYSSAMLGSTRARGCRVK